MTIPENTKVGSRILLSLACLIVVIAGLKAAEALVIPFLLALFLSMLTLPIIGWLSAHRWPQWLAILFVMLGLVVMLVIVGGVIGGSVNAFTQALPNYQARITELMNSLEMWLESWGIEISMSVILEIMNPGQIFQFAGGLLSTIAGILSNFFLVVLTTVFILTEASGFRVKLRAAFGDSGIGVLEISNVMTQVHRYIAMKTVISLSTGLVVGGWVWFLGVDFPSLWGLLAFLLNYIPNIGSIMAAVPPVLLALIQPGGGVGLALTVALGYITVNVLLGNVIEIRLMGQRLGLSTLIVFVSLVFWGWVWGGVGMLLSVPLTMVVKILLQNSAEWRWVALLMDKSAGDVVPVR